MCHRLVWSPVRLIVVAFSLACASWPGSGAWGAADPSIDRLTSVRDGRTGEAVPLSAMIDRLAGAEVVFLGESHDDETTHRVELEVYNGLLARRGNQVVLAMEMFERDVQPVLDDYVAGRIDEATFLARSRPWANHGTAYRALIERAKELGRPVIASNFPLPLRRRVAAEGADVLKNLPEGERSHAPREFLPNTEAYWRRADNAMRGHAGMMPGGKDPASRLHSPQSLWDNAMGEACADALDKYPGHCVLHVNGGFHSETWDGTVRQLKLRKPEAKVLTVAIVPVANPASTEVGRVPVADFVVLAEARPADQREGLYSVYGQQAIKYRLHVPEGASAAHPVPMLIWLSDDGFTESDGLDLWKDRLGGVAAVVAVQAPYRETPGGLRPGRAVVLARQFRGGRGLPGVGGRADLRLRRAVLPGRRLAHLCRRGRHRSDGRLVGRSAGRSDRSAR